MPEDNVYFLLLLEDFLPTLCNDNLLAELK